MSTEQQGSDTHKFLHDSDMTYQDVFNYAFRWLFIPLLQDLGTRLGEDNLIAMLKEATAQVRIRGEQQAASQVPSNDLATFTAWAREPNPFWQNTLTFEIVEDTETAFEVKVTECLWAKTKEDSDDRSSEHTEWTEVGRFVERGDCDVSARLRPGADDLHQRWDRPRRRTAYAL